MSSRTTTTGASPARFSRTTVIPSRSAERGGGAGQLLVEDGQLVVPPDDARTPRPGRPRYPPPARSGRGGDLLVSLPADLHGGHGLGQPFEGQTAAGEELEAAPGADEPGQQFG